MLIYLQEFCNHWLPGLREVFPSCLIREQERAFHRCTHDAYVTNLADHAADVCGKYRNTLPSTTWFLKCDQNAKFRTYVSLSPMMHGYI